MANILSKVALLYGILWIITFFFPDILFVTIVSGFGVVLLIVVAGVLETEIDNTYKELFKFKTEVKQLKKELAELKAKASTS